jgi:Rgg/GadR/MutR family transcriptional activator
MEIGSLLREYRLQKELTQKEFIKNCISESYYSKVENNLHRICAEDLFILLENNSISIAEFVNKLDISDQKSPLTLLEGQMYQIFYDNKIAELIQLEHVARDHQGLSDSEKKIFITLLEVLKAISDHSDRGISEADRKFLYSRILSDSDWSTRSLMLFANTLHIFDFEDTVFLVQSLIRKRMDYSFMKTGNENPFLLTTILLNFISICIKKNELVLTRKPFQLLNKLPKTPDFTFFRLMSKYYQIVIECINEHRTFDPNITHIIQSFHLIGREPFGEALIEFAELNIPNFKYAS